MSYVPQTPIISLSTPVSVTNWVLRNLIGTQHWSSICYGNDIFVAVSNTGTNRVATSPDGENWTFRTAAAPNAWQSVCFGNGMFVAVSSSGSGNRVMTSPDGIAWTSQTSAADNSWSSVCFGNGKFVAVSSDGIVLCVMTSTNGSSWSIQTGIGGPLWAGVAYGNGLYVAVGVQVGGTCMMTSSDGTTWAVQHTPGDSNYSFEAVAYGNNMFVTGGEASGLPNIMTSPDGTTWTLQSTPQDLFLQAVAYGGGVFVAVAQDGPTGLQTIYSRDGKNWASLYNPEVGQYFGVAYGSGRFVAVSQGGTHRAITMDVSENPNPSFQGVGGMYEYQNAISMGIDQVNTYHPMWTSGVVAGALDGWTFLAGTSGTFTSVTNAGGGQLQFTTSAPHGMSAGQVVTITSASVAGYQPPNPTSFVIQSVGSTTFNVVGTFTSTATGTWTRGACITAGAQAAGYYQLFWSVSCQASSGSNKRYRFEPLQNTTNVDKAASENLINSTGPQSQSASAFIVVAAGNVVQLLCANMTDTTDVTIIDMNTRVIRYS